MIGEYLFLKKMSGELETVLRKLEELGKEVAMEREGTLEGGTIQPVQVKFAEERYPFVVLVTVSGQFGVFVEVLNPTHIVLCIKGKMKENEANWLCDLLNKIVRD